MRLAYLTLGGLAVGLLVGWIADWVEHRIDDGPIEIALSILIPYAAYLTADRMRASGVLAVVACGLYLSRRSSEFFSPQVRLQAWAVWEALDFILNGLVFVLIGLQLPYVLAGIHDYSHRTLLLYGASVQRDWSSRCGWSGYFPAPTSLTGLGPGCFIRDLLCPTVKGIVVAGLDGNAGSNRARRCHRIAPDPGGWQPFPAAQPDRLSRLRCNFRDPGPAGTDASLAGSAARYR